MAIVVVSPTITSPHFLYRSGSVPDYRGNHSFFRRYRPSAYPASPLFASFLWRLGGGTNEPHDYVRLIPSGPNWHLQLRSINASGVNLFDPAEGSTNIALNTNYTLYIVQSGLTLSVYLNGVLECQGVKSAHHAAAPNQLIIGAARLDGTEMSYERTSDIVAWTEAHNGTQRTNVITNGADAESSNLWERWSCHRHLDIGGDVNGRALSLYGSGYTTADEPQVPGLSPADLNVAAFLRISSLPGKGSIGGPLTNQPSVEARTLNDAVDTSFTGVVTATLVTGDATLTGDTTKAAASGVAVFDDLGIDDGPPGLHYQIEFSAAGVDPVTSPVFAMGPEFRPSIVLEAQGVNGDGVATTGKTFTWSSSDETVATVSTNGANGRALTRFAGSAFIVAVGAGTCTITPHCVEDDVDGDPITVTVLAAG